MQFVSCGVRLGGRTEFEVQKHGVSVAEILVLRAIHGDFSVVKVEPTEYRRCNPAKEKQRLLALYGRKEEQAKMIEALFPGAVPSMPRKLEDVGLGEAADDPVAGAKPIQGEQRAVVDDEDEGEESGDGSVDAIEASEPEDYRFLNQTSAPKPMTAEEVAAFNAVVDDAKAAVADPAGDQKPRRGRPPKAGKQQHDAKLLSDPPEE